MYIIHTIYIYMYISIIYIITWKANCPISKAKVAGFFFRVKLPQKIGRLAFQVYILVYIKVNQDSPGWHKKIRRPLWQWCLGASVQPRRNIGASSGAYGPCKAHCTDLY